MRWTQTTAGDLTPYARLRVPRDVNGNPCNAHCPTGVDPNPLSLRIDETGAISFRSWSTMAHR